MTDKTSQPLTQEIRQADKGPEETTPAPGKSGPEAETGLAPAPPTPKDFQNIGYVLLGLTAIFAINAMETGSYRTPWPVPLGLAVLSGGLLFYGNLRKKQKNSA